MKKVLWLMVLFLVAFAVAGCGKPPKDVARKLALSYVDDSELVLADVEYLSAYAKEGGYTVNVRVGDAICEMPMIKGEKGWLAKGISCNGSFLSSEKRAERRRSRLARQIKDAVESENRKGPRTFPNGVKFEKASFDGSIYKIVLISPHESSYFSEKFISTVKGEIIDFYCWDDSVRQVLSAGFSYFFDISSSDGGAHISIPITEKDCV
jgi:hypothetical protein